MKKSFTVIFILMLIGSPVFAAGSPHKENSFDLPKLPVKYDREYTANKVIIKLDVGHQKIVVDGRVFAVVDAHMVNDTDLQLTFVAQEDMLDVPCVAIVRPSYFEGKYNSALIMFSTNLDFLFVMMPK